VRSSNHHEIRKAAAVPAAVEAVESRGLDAMRVPAFWFCADNLHFDDVIPRSRGGSSLTAEHPSATREGQPVKDIEWIESGSPG
jgi:homoserine kinase